MDLGQALRTTGAVRRFTPEIIDDATIHGMLDDARFAPSGGNRQGWRVAVIKDRGMRAALGGLMQTVWNDYIAISATGETPFNCVSSHSGGDAPAAAAAPHVQNELLDAIVDIPVVLVIAADLSRVAMMDKDLPRESITGGGSIYPFCWNLLLAARSRGLGGVMTTFLARAEPEAAELLHLPGTWAIAGMVFIGRPVHQPTRLTRTPVEQFSTIDTFDGDTFDGRAAG